jgi:phosphoribosylamine--glycine ligase
MNILLIDSQSCFLDFAIQCTEAGHTIRWFVGPNGDGSRSLTGLGLNLRVPHWEPHMNWADLIVTSDNAKYTHTLEGYRARGYPIFGPNKESTSWELDRAKGQGILEKFGIDTIPSVEFKNYDKAIAHVEKNMKRYVSKPNGDVDKALSYVSKSPADMIFMLEHWKKEGKMKDCFILQEFHGGIEMAVGGWMGLNGFSDWWCENFEHKKLMNGDKGVNTGEMGTVLKYVRESLLADMLLRPIEPELIRQGYTGYIDVSVIIDKAGKVWPLEFTTRPGWPLFQIQHAVHRGDPAQWMLDAMNGKDTFRPSEDVALGIVIAMPDFPYSRLTKKECYGYPVYGMDKPNIRKHIHPAEMAWDVAPTEENGKIVRKPMLVSAGDYVLVVSGTGEDVKSAQEACYGVVEKIELPNSPMYRTDIGDRVIKQLPELQKLGFALEW